MLKVKLLDLEGSSDVNSMIFPKQIVENALQNYRLQCSLAVGTLRVYTTNKVASQDIIGTDTALYVKGNSLYGHVEYVDTLLNKLCKSAIDNDKVRLYPVGRVKLDSNNHVTQLFIDGISIESCISNH